MSRKGSFAASLAAGQRLPAPPSKPNKARTYTQAITQYRKRFRKDDDETKVTEAEREARKAHAAEMADEYYDFATFAYISNWASNFHYSPFYPSATLLTSQIFLEHRLASLLCLRPGQLVLDVGCGIGGPAREIARFTQCRVVGISINQRQIDIAIRRTAVEGLSHLCTFIRGDFLSLPFPDSSFDAAFGIEATCNAPDLRVIYTEMARVVKPGGHVGVSEWVLTPQYNATNPSHVAIRNRIERGCSISNLVPSSTARSAFISSGLTLIHDEDFAHHFDYAYLANPSPGISPIPIPSPPPTHPSYDPKIHLPPTTTNTTPVPVPIPIPIPFDTTRPTSISIPTYTAPPPIYPPTLPTPLPTRPFRPWYHILSGNTHLTTCNTDKFLAWKLRPFARRASFVICSILEFVHIYPQGVKEAIKTMEYCVDSVEEGGREGIFTPSWFFVGRLDDDDDDDDDDDGRRQGGSCGSCGERG